MRVLLIVFSCMNLTSAPHIDFYVSVIDNYGDMGFAVNLALSLHEKYPNTHIRFFSDNEGLFRTFLGEDSFGWIQYMSLGALRRANPPAPSKLIFSFFDYPIPKEYLAGFPYQKTIVSFSYFLLHRGLESLHTTTYTLESGYDTVIHFIPSLLPRGGGIIINPTIEEKRKAFLGVSKTEARRRFLEGIMGTGKYGNPNSKNGFPRAAIYEKNWVSVFVYRETLEKILPIIERGVEDTVFWVCGDTRGIEESPHCRIMPFLSLVDYGVFQSLCDANIVRGENSLCQGLLSGKPVLWDIYKESNGAHREKTEDFLEWIALYFGDGFEYPLLSRDFMNTGNAGNFERFIRECRDFEKAFETISDELHRGNNLAEKLENIP